MEKEMMKCSSNKKKNALVFWNENPYWYRFLMSGMVHSITAAVANVHDICEAHKLIRTEDEIVYEDAGYLGIEKCKIRKMNKF